MLRCWENARAPGRGRAEAAWGARLAKVACSSGKGGLYIRSIHTLQNKKHIEYANVGSLTVRRGAADAKKKTVWAFWHQPTNCRGSSGPGAPASFAAFALFPPGESPTATDRPTDRPTDRSTGGPRGAASERAARARGAAGIVFLRMCGRCQVPQPELQVAISYVVFRTALSALPRPRLPPLWFYDPL